MPARRISGEERRRRELESRRRGAARQREKGGASAVKVDSYLPRRPYDEQRVRPWQW